MTTVKRTTIGNSTGIILPRELLDKLRGQTGDILYVWETPGGLN
ncbi:MAG: hypothetical protein OHK0029_15340 [Armatimonadaceae bacterium]